MIAMLLLASCGRAPSVGTSTSPASSPNAASSPNQAEVQHAGIWNSVVPVGLDDPTLSVDHVAIASDGHRIAWSANWVGLTQPSHSFVGIVSLQDGSSPYHRRLDFDLSGISLNHDGSQLFIAGNGVRCLDLDGKQLWHVETDTQFDAVSEPVAGVLLAADKQRVLLIDAATGTLKSTFTSPDHAHTIGDMSLSSDCSRVIVTSQNTRDEFLSSAPLRNFVYILDAKSLKLLDTLDLAALQCGFRPDAVSNDGNQLFVHENSTSHLGECSIISAIPPGIRKFVTTVPAANMLGGSIFPAFSDDGRLVYLAGYFDKTARGIPSLSDTLLAFNTGDGTLAQEFNSLPSHHFITSARIKPSLDLAVFGVRHKLQASGESLIYWTKTTIQ
ncbi:MAG TPA: hypothetical protein VGN88_13035 [Phycisphaerae bacterium]